MVKVTPTWNEIQYFSMIDRRGLATLDNGKRVRIMHFSKVEIEMDEISTSKGIKLGLKKVDNPNYDYIGCMI
jgi:hypothetical protein